MKSDLRQIPGVGKSIEQDLLAIGVRCVADLRGRDPEQLYQLSCLHAGMRQDRCLLYVYRLAVYYAEQEVYEAEKLKWWYWKDHPYPPRKTGEEEK